MKILITGIYGLIGSNVGRLLNKQGYEVVGIDNESICPASNVDYDVKVWHCDLLDKERAKHIIGTEKPEVVIHCAAWAHEGVGQFSPQLITENNLNIFLNTLVPSINAKVKQFITFSSVAAYGDQEPPFTEDMPLKPVDIYGANKEFLETTLKVLSKIHDFKYTILRCYNVFGEGQSMTDPYRGVVAIFMNNLMKGLPISVYGDGGQVRAFTYIGDIAPYIASCVDNEKALNQVFNLGDDKTHTVNDLVVALESASGKKFKINHLPDRAAEVKFAYCDNTKAKNVLGLEIKHTFDDAIKNTWDFASKYGPQEPKYLNSFEIDSPKIPSNWKK